MKFLDFKQLFFSAKYVQVDNMLVIGPVVVNIKCECHQGRFILRSQTPELVTWKLFTSLAQNFI